MRGDSIDGLEQLARIAAGRDTITLPTITFPAVKDPGDGSSPAPSPDEGPRRVLRRPSPPPWALGWARLGPAALGGILAGQAVLAVHLARTNTAFIDEALYLWAGHLQWAHWLHGEAVPAFPAYFSGAPVIYPPLAALADSAGGLAAARGLSCAFILAATGLLYAATTRLYGRQAGVFAAGLWAFLGPALHLAAFATYDAMALCLMAASVWCIVRANGNRDAAGWIFLAAVALAASNATAYSSAILDPAVIAVALLACPLRLKIAGMRATALAAYAAALVILAATAGGGLYFAGIAQTVLARTVGTQPAPAVLAQAWGWSMMVLVPALAGLLIAAFTETRRRRALLAVLTGAALLVPVEQARLHTSVSLDKHTAFGAWFAAVAAGWAVAKILSLAADGNWQRWVAACAAVAIVALPVWPGVAQARAIYSSWPDAAPFLSVFAPLAARSHGRFLVEASPVAEYYLPSGHQWRRWSSAFSVMLPNGHGSGHGVGRVLTAGTYAPFIDAGYFSLVALNFSNSVRHVDNQLAVLLDHSPRYRRVATAPYGAARYIIWQRVR